MSEQAAAWPIRVGGIHQAKYRDGMVRDGVCFRVTAVDGETVFFVHRRDNGYEHDPTEFTAKTFRNLSFPEDQSPIPDLVEALKEAREEIMGDHHPDHPTIRNIDAALAKAGEL